MTLRSTDAMLATLLLGVILTVSGGYVLQENTYYWWDYADYHNYALIVANAFRDSFGDGVTLVRQTLTQQKNALHVFPLLPFLLLGGESRLAYVLGVAVMYLFPFCLGMGAMATQLGLGKDVEKNPRRVFWTATFLPLLLPPTWVPLLRGYPDIGGAMLLVWGSWLYLRNPRLTDVRQILAMGTLLGWSVLFRRHFAYGVLTLLLAAWLSWGVPRRWRCWRDALGVSLRLAAVAAVSGVWVAAVAWEFAVAAATTDFVSRYQIWQLPVGEMLGRTGVAFGWGVWLLAGLGFAAGGSEGWRRFGGLALLLALGFLTLRLRYGNVHYLLHVIPWLSLGVLGVLGSLWQRRRWLLLAMLGLFLWLNLSLGLGGLAPLQTSGWMLVKAHPPLVRGDLATLRELILELRSQTVRPTTANDTIAVVAASNRFNASLLLDGEFLEFGTERRLNWLALPILDGGASPVPVLQAADWVVWVTPLQVIQPWEEQIVRSHAQDVVRVTYEMFAENWEIARDFRRLPQVYELDKGMTAYLYQRVRPTSAAVAERTEARVQRYLDRTLKP